MIEVDLIRLWISWSYSRSNGFKPERNMPLMTAHNKGISSFLKSTKVQNTSFDNEGNNSFLEENQI